MMTPINQPSVFDDPEYFSVPEDNPSSFRGHRYSVQVQPTSNPQQFFRLKTMKEMNFASLVKPSPFQKNTKTTSSAESSPVHAKTFRSKEPSHNNSSLSTCPYFFGSNHNITSSLPPKEEIDPLVESIRSDVEPLAKEDHTKVQRKSIIKMGSKSKYSKGYDGRASVRLLPDMASYNSSDDIQDPNAEEILYPNKYVIEVSESDEESEDSDESELNPDLQYQPEPEEKVHYSKAEC